MNTDDEGGEVWMPTEAEMVGNLRAAGLQDDEIISLLKLAADRTGGWTPRLNKMGLLVLKPDAPEGQEKEA